jgi:hypothetical protein
MPRVVNKEYWAQLFQIPLNSDWKGLYVKRRISCVALDLFNKRRNKEIKQILK